MRYEQPYQASQAGEWLVETVQRKPEALLLLAAGCAMLMYSGRRPARSPVTRWNMGDDTRWDPSAPPTRSTSSATGGTVTERVTQYAGGLADKASETADQVSETAKAYASTVADTASDYADTARRAVSDYADDARRNLSETSERVRATAESTYQSAADVIREQPILVGALGLIAGAGLAALFPATSAEKNTLGAASAVMAETATKVGEQLVDAAGRAGERLKEAAAERGLDANGLKDMARDVAGTFADAASGNDGARDKSGSGTGAKSARSGEARTDSNPTLSTGSSNGSASSSASRGAQTSEGSSNNAPRRS
jgi:ElaB/YqjD/DUF883 family membrane-anchored ribosome-binding protein